MYHLFWNELVLCHLELHKTFDLAHLQDFLAPPALQLHLASHLLLILRGLPHGRLFQCSNRLWFRANLKKWIASIGFSKTLNLYPMSISQLILFASFKLLSATEFFSTICIIRCIIRRLVIHICKSSSFWKTWRISFGIGIVDRPTLSAFPNIVSYGDHFIPTWSCRFFWNGRRCMPVVQSVVLFSLSQRTKYREYHQ